MNGKRPMKQLFMNKMISTILKIIDLFHFFGFSEKYLNAYILLNVLSFCREQYLQICINLQIKAMKYVVCFPIFQRHLTWSGVQASFMNQRMGMSSNSFENLNRFLKINIRLGLMLFLVFHKETHEIILPCKRSTPSYPPLSFNNLPADQRKWTDFYVIVTSVMKNRIGHNWTHMKFFR